MFHSTVVDELGAVDSIHFSPVAPHKFAVTAGFNISLYDPITFRPIKKFSRFTKRAFSGAFRRDGKLLSSGSEDGHLFVFDTTSRLQLQHYSEHTGAVRTVRWMDNLTQLVSVSDDHSARLWDLTRKTSVWTLTGHKDYARSLVISPEFPGCLFTGSYDFLIRFWDPRSSIDAPQFSLNHGAPVEDILVLPGGTTLVAAGSNYLSIWDLTMQKKLFENKSHHNKTITSIAYDIHSNVLFTGSLDSWIKFYNVAEDWNMFNQFKTSGPVLSLAISPDNRQYVVGLSNRKIVIRSRAAKLKKSLLDETHFDEESDEFLSGESALGVGSNVHSLTKSSKERNFVPGKYYGGTYLWWNRGQSSRPTTQDIIVTSHKTKPKMMKWDILLRKYQYQQALDSVIRVGNIKYIVALFHELVRRGDGLRIALHKRNDETLSPILSYLIKYINEPEHSILFMNVASRILDIYSSVAGLSPLLYSQLHSLSLKLKTELEIQRQSFYILGILDSFKINSSPID